MNETPRHPSRPGLNVIGFVSGNLGIGVTTRQLVHALLEGGHDVATWDLDPGLGRCAFDRRFDSLRVSAPEQLPHPINLVVLPPSEIPGLLGSAASVALLPRERLNAVFSMWELTVLPETARSAMGFFDVAIGESEFVRSCFATELEGVHVLGADHPFELGDFDPLPRSRFGLVEDELVFLSMFDVLSDPERKNPLAVVEAFEKAGLARPGYTLLIKISNAGRDGDRHPVEDELAARCARQPQVRILDATLNDRDMLALHACCDVYVSLHRSEGLGLCMMEAMALGKPVIATGWSGNTSFMDAQNACLVGHDLVPVRGAILPYDQVARSRRAVWAEPRVGEAADWMARLADDPALRETKGRRARADMSAFGERAARLDFVSELIRLHEAGFHLSDPSRRQKLLDSHAPHGPIRSSWMKRIRRGARVWLAGAG